MAYRKRLVFSGTPKEYLYLVKSWGQAAIESMRRGEDNRAKYAAELAVRFGHKGGLIERDPEEVTAAASREEP